VREIQRRSGFEVERVFYTIRSVEPLQEQKSMITGKKSKNM